MILFLFLNEAHMINLAPECDVLCECWLHIRIDWWRLQANITNGNIQKTHRNRKIDSKFVEQFAPWKWCASRVFGCWMTLRSMVELDPKSESKYSEYWNRTFIAQFIARFISFERRGDKTKLFHLFTGRLMCDHFLTNTGLINVVSVLKSNRTEPMKWHDRYRHLFTFWHYPKVNASI